jgi:hypothetical protein
MFAFTYSVLLEIMKYCTGTPFSSTNKTDRHDIAEILLKVALNTIALNIELIVNMLYKFAVLEMKI